MNPDKDINENNITSTFPAPPPRFRLYSDENWRLDPKLKPPPIPEGEGINIFGKFLYNERQSKSLKDLDLVQVYDSNAATTVADKISTLKRLHRSILFNYLELLQVLKHNPSNWWSKVNHIEVLLYNFHHLLNQFRPAQAQNYLLHMFKSYIEEKKTAIRKLEASVEASTELLNSRKFPNEESVFFEKFVPDVEVKDNPEVSLGISKSKDEWYGEYLKAINRVITETEV